MSEINHEALAFALEQTDPKTGRRYPGKFEGEPEYVAYFYAVMLDGCGEDVYEDTEDDEADEAVLLYTVLDIEDPECAQWPDLAGYRTIRISESDQGFVGHSLRRK